MIKDWNYPIQCLSLSGTINRKIPRCMKHVYMYTFCSGNIQKHKSILEELFHFPCCLYSVLEAGGKKYTHDYTYFVNRCDNANTYCKTVF